MGDFKLMLKSEGRLTRFYFTSLIGVIFVTLISKGFMLASGVKLLSAYDDVLGIRNWLAISGACLIELALLLCIISRCKTMLKCCFVLWVSLCFGIYRAFLQFGGFIKPCNCLGRFPQILHMSNAMVSVLMWAVLAYMAAGAIIVMISQKCKSNPE